MFVYNVLILLSYYTLRFLVLLFGTLYCLPLAQVVLCLGVAIGGSATYVLHAFGTVARHVESHAKGVVCPAVGADCAQLLQSLGIL